MSHKARQVRAGLLYLTATLLDSLVPFVTLPFFTRILSPGDFGMLALAQVYALIVGGLANFGMATAYNRNYFEYCEDKKKTGELFFTTVGFVSVLSGIMIVVTMLFQNSLSFFVVRASGHGPLLVWALAGNTLINLRLFFLVYLRNMERHGQYVANTLALSVLTLGSSLYFVVVAKVGVIGIIYGQVLASCIILSGLWVQFLRELPIGCDIKLLVDELKIGGPIVPMVFFSAVSNHFDKYLLGLLATLDGVGVYSIGQKIAMLSFTFMTSLQNVFSPQVYKKMFTNNEDSRREIGEYLLPFAYLICFVGLGIALFSEEIIRVMAPPDFASAADIIIFLTLFYAVLFFAKINGDQLIYAKKTYLTSALILAAAILNVVVNIPFIKTWGAEGAACATFLARALAGLIIFKVAQKFFRITWPLKSMILIFGTLLFSTLGLLVLRHGLCPYPWRLFYKISILGFYIFIGKHIGLLTRETISLVLPFFSKFISGRSPQRIP